jgi:hypothetical protein
MFWIGLIFLLTIESEWFSGKAEIRTYNINELLGNKTQGIISTAQRKGFV